MIGHDENIVSIDDEGKISLLDKSGGKWQKFWV